MLVVYRTYRRIPLVPPGWGKGVREKKGVFEALWFLCASTQRILNPRGVEIGKRKEARLWRVQG
jgi:hypothetical protein